MVRWAPALRMARRDLRRHRVRTVLTAALVALPVLVGVAAAELAHNTRWEGEQRARMAMGGADAEVEVTPFVRARVSYGSEDMMVRPASFRRDDTGKQTPARRPRAEVDLTSLLPAGSRVTPAPVSRGVALASGGVAQVEFLDVRDPMAAGLAALASGVAPTAPDEIAVNAPAADELGALDENGTLRADAILRLLDGTRLRVVGVAKEDRNVGNGNGVSLLAPPTSRLLGRLDGRLNGRGAPTRYLVDLPDATGAAPHALAASLARHGVAMRPRDVLLHPQAWHVPEPPPAPMDAASAAKGALVVLFGLVEVVLLVGSAMAVGARRQVRDLGLLAASGGAPSDVRRVLLAQGLVLGAGASVLGAAAGIGVFRAGIPLYERLSHTTVWTREIDWVVVGAVTLLGSLTGLAAALIPAWSIGRLTPVSALSGRFPVRGGESRAHRPAFALAGAGLVALALGGWWTAREYAPLPETIPGTTMFDHEPSPLPVALGGLGLLLLIAGVVWSAPYVVRRVAALGRLLPLSGRFAFRDAARHRFRTAAAAVALTVTAAGAVLAGFVAQAVEATARTDSALTPHSLMLQVDEYGLVRSTAQRRDRLLATVEDIVGPMRALTAYRISSPGRPSTELVIPDGDNGYYGPVSAVDDSTLRYLAGPRADAAVEVFRSGGLVTTDGAKVRNGSVTAALVPGARKAKNRFTLAAAVIPPSRRTSQGELSTAWVSRATAHRLGLTSRPSAILVIAHRQITPGDLTRLSVHGIYAWSPDADWAQLKWVGPCILGVTGLLTMLVIGIAVALSASEAGPDLTTMTAVGAGPWRRRSLGAMHGLFLGLIGALLGLVIGLPAGASLVQVDGVPGVAIPWTIMATILLALPLVGWGAGWVTTPIRLALVRRSD